MFHVNCKSAINSWVDKLTSSQLPAPVLLLTAGDSYLASCGPWGTQSNQIGNLSFHIDSSGMLAFAHGHTGSEYYHTFCYMCK